MSCCNKKKEVEEEDVESSGRILKKKKKPEEEDVVSLGRILGQLPSEYPKMVFGSILAILNGLMLPAFSVIFGQLFNSFYSTSGSALQNKVDVISLSFLGLAIASFLLSYSSNVLWTIAGERTATHMREKYLVALLHQEVAFYDEHASGSLTGSLLGDITIVQGGISEKIAQAFSFIAQMAGGVIIAFVFGWKMTLVMLAASPLMIAVGALQTIILTSSNKSGKKVYNQANEVAAEALGGIRTVYSFVAEEVLTQKYSTLLQTALINNAKKAHLVSAGIGFSFFFMFGVYALGFWYGGKLIVDGDMEPGDVLTVFFSIMIGAMAIGQASQLNPDIAKAKAAATTVFKVIDRVPLIQSNEINGKTIENLKGKIQLKKVTFTYPCRPDTKVCKSMSLIINPGQTVALVGPSGSGKSTVIQLLERFYDPQKGKILVDDMNISEFDLKWYRKNIGLVSQEPILFSGTITENIRFGKGDATLEEVHLAAKMANAYDFIMEQPDQFETMVGEKGIQLSGGQKQRVAIARAILKDPKILLLDEATSALDAESESLVQDALDKLMKGRTTVIIAHRLTTVRNANKICVIMNGKIVEEGNHETLLSKGGVYSNLVSKQLTMKTEPKKIKTKKEKKKKEKDLEKVILIDSPRFIEDQ